MPLTSNYPSICYSGRMEYLPNSKFHLYGNQASISIFFSLYFGFLANSSVWNSDTCGQVEGAVFIQPLKETAVGRREGCNSSLSLPEEHGLEKQSGFSEEHNKGQEEKGKTWNKGLSEYVKKKHVHIHPLLRVSQLRNTCPEGPSQICSELAWIRPGTIWSRVGMYPTVSKVLG